MDEPLSTDLGWQVPPAAPIPVALAGRADAEWILDEIELTPEIHALRLTLPCHICHRVTQSGKLVLDCYGTCLGRWCLDCMHLSDQT